MNPQPDEYAVEVQDIEGGAWRVRYGWFSDGADEMGFDRAIEALEYTVARREYPGARIVKRVSYTTLVTLGDPLSQPISDPWPMCSSHKEVQHRDGRRPWCNACGWNRGGPALHPQRYGDR